MKSACTFSLVCAVYQCCDVLMLVVEMKGGGEGGRGGGVVYYQLGKVAVMFHFCVTLSH